MDVELLEELERYKAKWEPLMNLLRQWFTAQRFPIPQFDCFEMLVFSVPEEMSSNENCEPVLESEWPTLAKLIDDNGYEYEFISWQVIAIEKKIQGRLNY